MELGKWWKGRGLERREYLVVNLYTGGLEYWSLFYQLETKINFGRTSGDQAAVFKGVLPTFGGW